MAKVKVFAIAAMDQGRVIGFQNKIPWYFPEDFKHFKALTTGHTVLMGRKTYQSLPEKSRPLPGRLNVVITSHPEMVQADSGVILSESPGKLLSDVDSGKVVLPSELLWIIGGAQIYRETVDMWQELYLTLVHSNHSGDTLFPQFERQFELVGEELRTGFSFKRYVRK
jgi:dihydrofolate reductase